MTTKEEQRMRETFEKVGKEFGFDEVTAEYVPFVDFKMRWSRSYKWIKLEVSDYFEGVPMNVIEGFARCIFTRIRGDSDVDYPKDVVECLTSEGFLERNQPLYLGRCKRLGLDPGRNVDIMESYRRLVEKGLTEDDPRLRIGWFDGRTQNPGTSSTLMKVVQIARALDDEDVSDNARDYALYQNIAHIDMGFNPRTGNGNRKKEFESKLDRYPGREDAERELMRLGFRV